MQLQRIDYDNLNARQKENFNYQKLSAVLADYGFVTLRLTDDWKGADLIARHISGENIPIQLKSRLTIKKAYAGQELFIAFSYEGEWYLYPHDEIMNEILARTSVGTTVSWMERGGYSFPKPPASILEVLLRYRIQGTVEPVPADDGGDEE